METTLLFICISGWSFVSAEFLCAFLQCHNDYRKKHGAPALSLNGPLITVAQKHADFLAEIQELRNSESGYGENIHWTPPSDSLDRETLAKAACDTWYSDIKNYDFDKPGFTKATASFTQMVWKSSTKLGGGLATSLNGGVYIVAVYDPVGNTVSMGDSIKLVLKIEPDRCMALTDIRQFSFSRKYGTRILF